MTEELKPFSPGSELILAKRYLVKDSGGLPERPEAMLWRVARAVALAEEPWGGAVGAKAQAKKYHRLMCDGLFLPNSPTLMNAGRRLGQLSACFVIPIQDSMDSIFNSLRDAALIHKSGGGTGFDFSLLRPQGDIVGSTSGISSGPLSFMGVYDVATEAVKQGGARRGANMAVLDVSHPDIEKFIQVKFRPGVLENFNLSVMAPDEFMEALKQGRDWPLINPRTGRAARQVDAACLFEKIVKAAHASGEPGMLFSGAINRANVTPALGMIRATNPCGEQPLLPYESCNLGSLVLPAFVRAGVMDWSALEDAAALAAQFLDDVIDVNRFPLEEVAKATRLTRKIGLGVMGLADALVDLGLNYDSEEARDLGAEIMRRINEAARDHSRHLGRVRGSFEAFGQSTLKARGEKHMRNATVTTVAPTGTLSLLMGCSAGIEPFFALAYRRRILDGDYLDFVHPRLESRLAQLGLYTNQNRDLLLRTGSTAALHGVPEETAKLFATAHEIAPQAHLAMQAAFQRHVDNGVSKTLNLPGDAGEDMVRSILMEAHALGLKGVTVFRNGCRGSQVLEIGLAGQEPRSRLPENGVCRVCRPRVGPDCD